ncbi:MAG: L,D-transpeptidase family protein [Anaerolineae bacterium]|jgi:lipoprotein-anchoring transpeptidase ErfK/SrfK|nr:L,D-transpeptidase family protein [Anaerolineae bacterium]
MATQMIQGPSRKQGSVLSAAGTAAVLLVLLLGVTAFCGWVFVQRTNRIYEGVIYPNVYALGIHLGGYSPEEAATTLETVADQVDTGMLVLTDGDRQWSFPWTLGGLRVDTLGTAQAAYKVGRGGSWLEQIEIWLYYHDVAPLFLFDTTSARELLAEVDREATQPTIDPTLKLEQGEVVIVPGQTGRVLDIPTTLARLREVGGTPYRVEVPLAFEVIPPAELDTGDILEQADALLARQITVMTHDVLTDETLSWTLGRDEIADWLYLVPGEGGRPSVDMNRYAIRDTLIRLAEGMGEGRGFRYDEAAIKVFQALESGQNVLWLYLTHGERTYTVVAGDTLTSLSAKFGMPAGLVAEANRDIDIDKLLVGQQIRIPSQDVLTPNMPVIGKKIIVSLAEQRTRVYENGQLLWDWPVSTGIKDSPTHAGTFQVLGKYEEAYASQWDLWMPYFIAVYPAGGGVENGFHELPILASGNRLWEGSLGRPASFGCIILGIPAAETLYNWAEVGITVVIE